MSAAAPRAELEALLRAALAAVHGERLVREAVRDERGGLTIAGSPVPAQARLVAVAAGKAAAAMARGLAAAAGPRLARGWLVTKDGHAAGAPPGWTVRESAHPVPDARSEAAARDLLAIAASTRADEVLVVLLSGGASALLACPLAGLTLDDLAGATRALLASGAAIDEVNAVRKHLVDVAGGRLARAAGAGRIEVLAVSDVPGDRLDVIGSGPCAPDPTRYCDALAVVARRGLETVFPAAVCAHLEAGSRGERPESPKPGDLAFARVRTTLLASNETALAAVRAEAERRGVRAIALAGALRGEARDAGRRLAALGRALRPREPLVVVAGGETTVTLRAPGRGGRSQELALAAAIALDGTEGVGLLAAGTDGSDGPTDAAGAYADGGTAARARARGLDPAAALARHESNPFFAGEGGLVRTGPTGTNVMDLVILRVAGGGGAANLPIPPASESV